MTLTQEQAEHFYKLWIPLLDFVNKKHEIDVSLYGMKSPKGLPLSSVRKIRDVLWNERSLIDEYIGKNKAELTEAEQTILRGWKSAVCDNFIVLRHLKSGSIFLPAGDENVAYIVQGIYSCWDEMLQGRPLPQLISVVLMPFEGKIISDGLLALPEIRLVGNMKRSVEDAYRSIKAAGGVLKSIEF